MAQPDFPRGHNPDVLSDVSTDRIVDEAIGFQGPGNTRENVSAATHPSNAAPGHPALTNVGTIYDSPKEAA